MGKEDGGGEDTGPEGLDNARVGKDRRQETHPLGDEETEGGGQLLKEGRLLFLLFQLLQFRRCPSKGKEDDSCQDKEGGQEDRSAQRRLGRNRVAPSRGED